MKNITLITALLLLTFLISACGGGGAGAGSAEFSDVVEDPSSPSLTPPSGPQQSAFKNFGYISAVMPLDFSSFQLDQTTLVLFYVRDSGFISPNVTTTGADHDRRRCRMYVTFTGSQSQGVLTISDAETAWKRAALVGTPEATYCEQLNGVYDYQATAQGLVLEGVTYAEVL